MQISLPLILCFLTSTALAIPAPTTPSTDLLSAEIELETRDCQCGLNHFGNSWGCGSPNPGQNYCQLIGDPFTVCLSLFLVSCVCVVVVM